MGELSSHLAYYLLFRLPNHSKPGCPLFQIPVVAVMATGGGVRAMTSLYGHLAGLRELGLLDCISYITGASGSTW